MKTEIIGTASVMGESVTYELIEEITDERKTYGVQISGMGESACVFDVFSDKKEAEEFAKRLCFFEVTPITLADVLTDYVDERDFICRYERSDTDG